MAILNQLGINQTTFYCLLIFLFTFFFLKELLFRPYFSSFLERDKRTKGGESTAKEMLQQAQVLKQQYEEQARDLNAEIKSIFDESRSNGSRETDKILIAAKKAAEQSIEQTRQKVSQEMKKAQDQLVLEVPGVALGITKKMLD
jgi:F0F1-type ATP synthase membrane subunit b/b'